MHYALTNKMYAEGMVVHYLEICLKYCVFIEFNVHYEDKNKKQRTKISKVFRSLKSSNFRISKYEFELTRLRFQAFPLISSVSAPTNKVSFLHVKPPFGASRISSSSRFIHINSPIWSLSKILKYTYLINTANNYNQTWVFI